jgi:hypothetical protein
MFHREFASFVLDIDSEYEGFVYYTEIRSLSCYRLLKAFYDLINEIIIFL